MFENLEAVLEKYNDLNQRLCQPEVTADPEQMTAVMKELSSISELAQTYLTHKKMEKEIAEANAISENKENEAELRDMAHQEAEELQTALEENEKQLRKLLIPRDEDDGKNVIIEIRGGAGGEESALFAGVLYRMYVMYCEKQGLRHELLSSNETELGGFKEVSFIVRNAYARFKFESGVHRVQRVPETESQGRIHTSTVTVAVLPEAEEVDVQINPADLQIDTFRSGGAGGQHINKTESAIRITHLPTGIVVECQDERSQYKNKDKAMRVLRSRIMQAERERLHAERAGERRSQVGTGDRSERIRTYNYPQGRVTDHRINLTLYRLEAILNGDLDGLIDALTEADTARRLATVDF